MSAKWKVAVNKSLLLYSHCVELGMVFGSVHRTVDPLGFRSNTTYNFTSTLWKNPHKGLKCREQSALQMKTKHDCKNINNIKSSKINF
jgi:hypothetical protein